MTEQNLPKVSERRQATVMFIDIAGFTEMSEKLDAEEVTDITIKCFEMMGKIIEQNGGTIDKFMGDSVMALFGVPTAIENSCNKALNTAIEIRNKFIDINQNMNLKIPLNIHIGINTGKVIAGLVGSSKQKDYTVMGDTVNIAARLEDASTAGQILVGDLTYHQASPEFKFKTQEPITLKGKEKPVPVHELLTMKSKVTKPQLDTNRLYSEMVGRNRDYQKLRLHVQNLINGKGRIVNVIGEPGIGKSRLIVELQNSEEIQKVTFLKGAASSIGKDLSYHPIIEIIQKWAVIDEEDNSEKALLKLERVINQVFPGGADEVLPFVATIMGLKIEGKYAERIKSVQGESLEKLILKNLKDLISEATKIRPIIFVVEDVHWADQTSIELLESLFRLADQHPILFINVFRPNYQETSDRLLATVRDKYPENHAEIFLEALDLKQVEVLVNNLLRAGTLPESVKTYIVNKAEGNPLFVEEVLSSFIDEGAVRYENGQFKVTEKINSVIIPGSIREVLMARLDRLDEKHKYLLKKASVIGRYFYLKILQQIVDHSEKINNQLAFLKELQLIKERMRFKDIEYFFKHVLMQEVTYQSILIKQRKVLHLEVADAIEHVFAHRLNEFFGVLSWHYGRGEHTQKQEEYLVKAGEEAVKAGASTEAINYYKDALDLYILKMGQTADQRKVAILEKRIASALYEKGRMAEAIAYIDKLFDYLGITIPKNRLSKTLLIIGTSFRIISQLYFQSKKEGKIPNQRVNIMLELMKQKAWALYAIGSPESMITMLLILELLHKYDIKKINDGLFFYAVMSVVPAGMGMSLRLSRKMLNYVHVHLTGGDLKSNFAYKFGKRYYYTHTGDLKNLTYEASLVEQGLRIGCITESSGYLIMTGFSLNELGNFSEVSRCCEKLKQIGEEYENDFTRTRKYFLNTVLLLKCRKLAEVINEANQAIPFMQKSGYPFYAFAVLSVKSNAHTLLNQIGEAEIALQQAKGILEIHGKSRFLVFLSKWHLSQFLFDLHQLEQAVNSGNKIKKSLFKREADQSGKVALKTALKYAPGKTEVFKLMGRYYWLLNKPKKALKWWKKSIETGEQLSAQPDLARTYLEVANRLAGEKRNLGQIKGIPINEYLVKAEQLFNKMDLVWDLKELEQVRLNHQPGGN